MEEEKDLPEPPEFKPGESIDITPGEQIPDLPDISITDLFDKDLIREGIETFRSLVNYLKEDSQAKNEIQKKVLDNQVELKRLEIEDKKQEYSFYIKLNLIEKKYGLYIIIGVIVASVLLRKFDIIDKQVALTIIVFAIGSVFKGPEIIQKLISKKKTD